MPGPNRRTTTAHFRRRQDVAAPTSAAADKFSCQLGRVTLVGSTRNSEKARHNVLDHRHIERRGGAHAERDTRAVGTEIKARQRTWSWQNRRLHAVVLGLTASGRDPHETP